MRTYVYNRSETVQKNLETVEKRQKMQNPTPGIEPGSAGIVHEMHDNLWRSNGESQLSIPLDHAGQEFSVREAFLYVYILCPYRGDLF